MNASLPKADTSGILFRYSADRVPISLFLIYFLADLTVFFMVENGLYVALWALSTLLPKACICAWNHHQQHCPTFRQRSLNRALETVYGLQTGALPFAWTLHHNLGHHINYLDQAKDESAWCREDGETMGAHEYSWTIFITSYARIWRVSKRYPRIQKKFLTWAFVTLVLLTSALVWNPFNALALFLIPMTVGLYVTAWHTYYHHAGLHSDGHTDASFNVIQRPYNLLTGNLGYHTAHHSRMGAHWSKLPSMHGEMAHNIPAHLYREPCIPFRWMGRSEHIG